MLLELWKYEGAGNDFLLFDARREGTAPSPALIRSLCERHRGLGADGAMILTRTAEEGCVMSFFNSDGSPGRMCGNGGRCFALFAHHLGLGSGDRVRFRAGDGPHLASIVEQTPDRGEVKLRLRDVERIECASGHWLLDTGVPHCVELVEDVDAVQVVERGRAIRYGIYGPQGGVNVNFVQVAGEGRLRMRTYERGVEGETLACGTGAAAAAIVVHAALQPAVESFGVAARGGDLRVELRPCGGRYTDIVLTGPARRVFRATIETENFILER